ncbi:MAG: hypothetical protein KME13_19100 [Myxacorys californica WJT36-NPBG1]|jgi:tetratricopeptide (TPR) repeat protein|nr:hypothetical protein [Myxacorys californica WJT36-NPBG1]
MSQIARLVLGAVLGLAIGIFSVHNPRFGIILFFLWIVRVALLLVFQRSYVEAVQLLNEGKFELALAKYEGLLARGKLFFWLKLLDERLLIYNIAVIYHQWGRFEESIAWLDKLDPKKVPKAVTQPYHATYAVNLLYLKGDLDLAKEHLDQAAITGTMPFFLLIYSYFYQLQHDFEHAKSYVDQYLEHPNRYRETYRQGNVRLKWDKVYVTTAENFYLGLYYQAVGDVEKAKEYLFVSAMSPYDNFLKREAYRIYNSLA